MEKLNPSFEVLFQVKKALLCGKSAHQSIQQLTSPFFTDEFGISFVKWINSGEKQQLEMESRLSPTRQMLMDIIRRAIKGEPILKALTGFQEDLKGITKAEIESHSSKLQVQMLFPVLILMLPAYLILLFGPIFREFGQALG